MKKFKDISEFENLLKDTLQGHSTPAPPDVWSSVAASTSQSAGLLSQVTTYFGSATNILKVALFAGGIAAVGIVIYTENTPEIAPVQETQNTEQQVDTISSDEGAEIENTESTIATEYSAKTNNPNSEKTNTTAPKEEKSSGLTEQVISTTDNTKNYKVDENSNTDKQEELPTKVTATKLSILASNLKPCIGETVVLKSTEKGNWFVNDKPIATNCNLIKYKCSKEGPVIFKLKKEQNSTITTVYIQKFTASILSNKINDSKFSYSLDNKNIIANWFLDNVLQETNSHVFTTQIHQVGEHSIKAVPVNKSCAVPIETKTTIERKGSIEIFDVFTPGADGSNDIYKVEISGYENFSIQIFNPAGKMVYASQNPEEGWNGNLFNMGNECINGVYAAKISYTLNGEIPETENIKITLKRP
jgi:gliding motility-associated-like protein